MRWLYSTLSLQTEFMLYNADVIKKKTHAFTFLSWMVYLNDSNINLNTFLLLNRAG